MLDVGPPPESRQLAPSRTTPVTLSRGSDRGDVANEIHGNFSDTQQRGFVRRVPRQPRSIGRPIAPDSIPALEWSLKF